MFYDAGSGMDSVEVHVWADTGGPARSADRAHPPFRVMPEVYPTATVVDLSGYNLVLASGDFHIGYVCCMKASRPRLPTEEGRASARSTMTP